MNTKNIFGVLLLAGLAYLIVKGIESGELGAIKIGITGEAEKKEYVAEKYEESMLGTEGEKLSHGKAEIKRGKQERIFGWGEEEGEEKEEKSEAGEKGARKFSKFAGAIPSFSEIVENVRKGVVNISTTRVERRANPFRWFFGPGPFGQKDPFEEFFKRFFGEPEIERYSRSLGSGFIVTQDGYIVTNSHVVKNARDINVTLWDGRSFKAKIVGIDDATDIAVLKIDAENLPYLRFGNSEDLKVGDWVIAIGNPFGLGHTVTVGVVSAKGRSLGLTRYEDFIQTDAAINPGNSGGPLINLKGEVVGINTAILNPSGMAVYAGIGFAIPASLAKKIVPMLIKKGKVERAWLGVYIQEVTPEIAKALGIKPQGALVSEVIQGSPADKAGIKRGDVIVEFDGKPVKSYKELPIMVSLTPINKKVKVKVIRNGEVKELEVVLGKMPEERVSRARPVPEKREEGITIEEFGFSVQDSPDGPRVSSVKPGSPAALAGIRPGDIIVEVNRQAVKSAEELKEKLKNKKSVLFLIKRGERTLFVAIRIG